MKARPFRRGDGYIKEVMLEEEINEIPFEHFIFQPNFGGLETDVKSKKI